MAKYSIILPVRNGNHYVKECVNSILSQTYTDFNFIILDNYSTDGTSEWVNSIKDNRIKIIPSSKSLSIEENWGRIKDIKKNEFITIIGHDDILYPNFLQIINCLIEENPSASLYHTHFNFIDANGKLIRSCKPMKNIYSGNEFLEAFLKHAIELMGTGYVMRSEDYDKLEGIPIRYPSLLFADFELWINLTLKGYEAVASENCFAFRVHKSTTGTTIDKKLHQGLEIFIGFLIKVKNRNKSTKKIIELHSEQFLLYYCKGYAHRLLRTPIKRREGITVNDFIEKTKKFAGELGVLQNYNPKKILSIRIAAIIDSNSLLRRLFLGFKKIHSKPF